MDTFYNGLQNLKNVAGVTAIHYGAVDKNVYQNYVDRSKEYTHCLLVELKNKNSLSVYDKDNLHTLVKSTIIAPALNTSSDSPIMAVDWSDKSKSAFSIMSYTQFAGLMGVFVLGVALGLKLRSRY